MRRCTDRRDRHVAVRGSVFRAGRRGVLMDEFDEIVREFLVESYENLDQLDRDLVALEQEPDAHPLLQSIFRTIHTIKGTSGFLAFGKLEVLTHAGEGLLSRLRDGGLHLTRERTTGLLQLVDAVRAILASIEATGHEDDRDYAQLVARLTALQAPDLEAEAAAIPSQGGAVKQAGAKRAARPPAAPTAASAAPPARRSARPERRAVPRPTRPSPDAAPVRPGEENVVPPAGARLDQSAPAGGATAQPAPKHDLKAARAARKAE